MLHYEATKNGEQAASQPALSAELIRMSFLIHLAYWQVFQASNHSHRSFIILLQFVNISFFGGMQRLEQDKGSLFDCRLSTVCLLREFAFS